MKDPHKVIKQLFEHALDLLIKCLGPYLEKIKQLAIRELQKEQVRGSETKINSATDVGSLLNDIGVCWEDVYFLSRAIACIDEESKKEFALDIVQNYYAYLKKYRTAVNIANGRQVFSTHTHMKVDAVLLEITHDRDARNYTMDDCQQLFNAFLIDTLNIPRERISYVRGGPANSTLVVFQVSQQFTRSIKEKLTESRIVCVMLQLDILRVRIPEICDVDLRVLTPQVRSSSIRAGLMANVDFISLAQVSQQMNVTSMFTCIPEEQSWQHCTTYVCYIHFFCRLFHMLWMH